MGRWFQVAKLVLANLAIFACLVIGSNFVFAVFFEFRDYTREDVDDPRARVPAYESYPWATQHFREFANLRAEYAAYTGWRRKPFDGQTITVDAFGRRAMSAPGAEPDVAFFGGSAIWGTGSRDHETIPAFVASDTGQSVVNFGETGWRAHQSLNQLIREFVAGSRFSTVIFYDGANEVAFGCRSDLDPFSHARAQMFAARIERRDSVGGLADFFAPTFRFARTVRRGLPAQSGRGRSLYDCADNPERTEEVVRLLLEDWRLAASVARQMGADFLGVLQPVAQFGANNVDGLRLSSELGRQFEYVYPRLRQALTSSDLPSLDLATLLEGEEALFVDWAHVVPPGNRLIATHLVAAIEAGRADDTVALRR